MAKAERSPPASLAVIGQVSEYTTVKWFVTEGILRLLVTFLHLPEYIRKLNVDYSIS